MRSTGIVAVCKVAAPSAEMRAQTRSAAASATDESTASLRISAVTLSRMESSSLLLFMMFLQIASNLFSQLCASPMQNYTDYHLRSAHDTRNLAIVVTFVITQHKHL